MKCIELKKALHIVDIVTADEGIKRKGKAIKKRLKALPGEDVEKVVRCKDCQFAEENGGDCNSTLPITYRNYVWEINETKYITLDFCSFGERKEGAD